MSNGRKDPSSANHSKAAQSTVAGQAPPTPAPSWPALTIFARQVGNDYAACILGLLGSRGRVTVAQSNAASGDSPIITPLSMEQMSASFAGGAYKHRSSARWVRAMAGPPRVRLEDERVRREALRAAGALKNIDRHDYKNWWELRHSPNYGLALADPGLALTLESSLESQLAAATLSKAQIHERVTEFEAAFRNYAVRLELQALDLQEQQVHRCLDNPAALDALANDLFTRFDPEERQVLAAALDRPAEKQRRHDALNAEQWGLAAVGNPAPELPPQIERPQARLMVERQSAFALASAQLKGSYVATMPGFEPEKVLRESTVRGVRHYVVGFLERFRENIGKTRDSLIAGSEHIYRHDKSVSLAVQSLGIVPGSTPALVVAHAVEEADALWPSQFEAIAQFSITAASLALGPASPLALEALNLAGMVYVGGKTARKYRAEHAAFGVGARSADPSLFWVVLALIGAGVAVARAPELLEELLQASRGLKGVLKSFYDTPDPASLETLLKELERVQLEASERAAIKEWALYLMHSRGAVSLSAAEVEFVQSGAAGKLEDLEILLSSVRKWSGAEGWQGYNELSVLEARRAAALERLQEVAVEPQELEQVLAETKAIEAELLDLEEVFRPWFGMWTEIEWLTRVVKATAERLDELWKVLPQLLARSSELSAGELSELQLYARRMTELGDSLPAMTTYTGLDPSTIRQIYQALRPRRERVPQALRELAHIESRMGEMVARMQRPQQLAQEAAQAARWTLGVATQHLTRIIAEVEERIAAARPLLLGAPEDLRQLASLEQRLLAEKNEVAQVFEAARFDPGSLPQPIKELQARALAAAEKLNEIETELNRLDPSINN